MSDIVERLRAGEPCEEEGGCACQVEKRNAASGCLCAVAADTITALRAEVERLRRMLWEINEQCPEHVPIYLLKQIRAALNPSQKPRT